MPIRLRKLWDDLRSSYWFVPSIMCVGAVVLAVIMELLDAGPLGRWLTRRGWLAAMGPAGARAVLSTVAASAITVASVVFSVSIVALSISSGQYGSRLIPNFMKGGGTQLAFGSFVGSFLYCLVVLSRVPDSTSLPLPRLAVAVGLLLGLFSFGVLVYFIHRVSVFIQAPRILESVATDLHSTFTRQFPERQPTDGEETPDEESDPLPKDFDATAVPVAAQRSGYVQAVDEERLLQLAAQHDLVFRQALRPGKFAITGHPLLWAHPAGALDDEIADALRQAHSIGADRTPTQDAEHALDQLVEVAVRALSPGINDPFTAITCVDQLGAALSYLAERRIPSSVRRDEDGRVRLVLDPYTYRGMVNGAFDQIRQHARDNLAVTLRLLETIERVASRELPMPYRRALARQAELIYQGTDERYRGADASALRERYDTARRACDASRDTPVEDSQ